MSIVILTVVMIVIFYLGRYAIREGQRIESQKKFMKNMNEYDKNKNKK